MGGAADESLTLEQAMLTEGRIAEQFELDGRVIQVRPYGRGIINDTFLVTTDRKGGERAVLQRINGRVFPEPALIMANLRTLLDHARWRQADASGTLGHFRLPDILPARDGRDYVVDDEGGFWRLISFIEGSCSIEAITTLDQAAEIGVALGCFHVLVSDLEADRLHDTLPGFHITPCYLERFNTLIEQPWSAPDSPELRFGLDFINARQGQAGVLEAAKDQGVLRIRPVHGDPKLSNILFSERSGRAASIIDLDTVKPGLLHYDIGDCLRSCCNTASQGGIAARAVDFDLDIARAILGSYFQKTREFLSRDDFLCLYEAIWLIPFELGVRFLTDYLEGNVYFRFIEPEENLRRAMVQFRLVESIERQEGPIRALLCR